MRPRRPRGIPARLAAMVLAWLAAAMPGHADPVVADLSSHIIAITSGFTGASVVLFGALEAPGDIIAVVRGPDRDTTVWRRAKIAGIWVNAESVTFADVPSFYSVVASRPLNELISPSTATLYRIGAANLGLMAKGPVDAERTRRFTAALIGEQRRAGLFEPETGKVSFLGDRLFRASLTFPANVPTGTYLVQVFLVREQDVVGGQTTPLVVSKVGLDAAVSDFATRQSAAYGAIAVVTAVVAGWLASIPFRGV